MLIRSLQRDTLLKRLEKSGYYSVTYRQLLDGKEQYVNLIAFRKQNDAKSIVIGVRNVDLQKRLETKSETYSHIAGALASRYEALYYINTDTNEYTMYSSSAVYAKLGLTKQGDDFFADAADDIRMYIHPDDIEVVLAEMTKERLIEKLEASGSLSFNYRQQLGERTQYVNNLIVRPKNDSHHIVMGVTNIDSQIRREQTLEEESRTFSEIARALAERYEVIYQVDLLTNEYREYSASEKYSKLKIGVTGADFFGETQQNLKRDVYSEDQPIVSLALQKENLLDSLRETGKYYLNYRLVFDGEPQYVMLFAVRPKEDSSQIIVAVANVDAAKRKELDFEEAIGSAIDMANRDALTGVMNKRAYAQTEMELDKLIEGGSAPDFALVVCDINGLKQVNDHRGHNSGDEFIKSACSIIADIFKNSTLYRVGGDEFVVLLKGEDYKNRRELIKEFTRRQDENRKNALVTTAFGMSDYERTLDMRLQDVFERADDAMYDNKRLIKNSLSQEELDITGLSETETDRRFNELFKLLISAMTDMNNIDIPHIEELLMQISFLLRLSKGVANLYKNPQEEREGKGESIQCFDTGLKGKVVHSIRTVTSVMSIASITVYMPEDAKPHSALEHKRLDLVMRATLSFVSRNRLRDIVERLAYYDDNGYRNQRVLMKYLNSSELRGKALINYNLRHFSLVNQEFGRILGDVIMRKHFEMIEEMIGENGIVCRLGGDNFSAVCDIEQLGKVTEFLSEARIVYDPQDHHSVNIPSSAGVAVVPADAKYYDPGELMSKSMTALRTAQSGGKDHIIYFNEAILERKEKSMRVQQLFPEALRNDEFRVFYQPKVNINTGVIEGAEALCRWFHDGKIVPPVDFIPMLEETNDICKLDFRVLELVCSDIRRWLDEGRSVVRISVNLSRKHMMDMYLLDSITEKLDRYGVPHSLIEIELTETTTDVEFNDLKRVVSGLQQAGICTSVDDFGVGYSSINLIRDMPWNVMKVDRSFLPIDKDSLKKSGTIMFKHVIAMAKELGLECIAEGVETPEHLEILRAYGCDYAQGFLFDKPLPYDEFVKRLEERRYPMDFGEQSVLPQNTD